MENEQKEQSEGYQVSHLEDEERSQQGEIEPELIRDYTEEFTTDRIFRCRQELIEWSKEVGKRNGLVIVTKTSDSGGNGRRPRLKLACERCGYYKLTVTKKESPKKKKKTIDTSTKKCGCPFLLRGIKLMTADDWTILVECGVHNHPVAEQLEGHSFVGRLTKDEEEILTQMSKSQVRPRAILTTLKQRDATNASTLRTIYNARARHKLVEKGGRSQIQHLMLKLAEAHYVEWHRCEEGTDVVKDLFWAHPVAIDLLRCFPKVLIMDCTYKTNRYRFPLLEIVGVTSTNQTFSVAFVYMVNENKENYIWALEKLKDLLDGWPLPEVIVTDRELALMNVVEQVFPNTTTLLCRWHISKNVLANCKKLFSEGNMWEAFMKRWSYLVDSATMVEYAENLGAMESDFSSYPRALTYVKDAWLDKCKEKFVSAWTNEVMHFGNNTTNRAERAHTKLKRHLGSLQGDFEAFWNTIHMLLELQHTEINDTFQKNVFTVQHRFRSEVFREIRDFVSRAALDIILEEMNRSQTIGLDHGRCGCVRRRTHGLPCAHEIVQCQLKNSPILLSMVDGHWTKLDMTPTKPTENKPDLGCSAEIEAFLKRYESSDSCGKARMLRKLKEL